MRNVFDQYSQPENRITHAFLTALNEDRRLLTGFLRDLVKVEPPAPASKLAILEQQYPGETEATENESDRRGIPDGTVTLTLGSGWCATNRRCTPSPIAVTGFQPRSSSTPFGYISGFR